MVMCRSEEPLDKEIREKIALFANLPVPSVVSARDVDSIYKVPLEFEHEGVAERVLAHFGIQAPQPDLSDWRHLVDRIGSANGSVRIALVGKYNQLADAYLSVIEALNHAATHHGGKVEVHWVDSERLTEGEVEPSWPPATASSCRAASACAGSRGRSRRPATPASTGSPILGICLGMQIAVSEFARHVAGMDARTPPSSTPRRPTP